jgi:hypothetical protein
MVVKKDVAGSTLSWIPTGVGSRGSIVMFQVPAGQRHGVELVAFSDNHNSPDRQLK